MSEAAQLSIGDIKPKMEFQAKVKRVNIKGALVDVAGYPAFLHISQIRKSKKEDKAENVSDVLSEGEEITVYVMEVDEERESLLVTMIKPPDVDWPEIEVGSEFTGTVVRLKKYGAFIDIGAERPGLVHVSELSSDYVEHPKDVLNRGDEVQVKVIGVDRNKNQIDLSIKALTAPEEAYTTPSRYDDDSDSDEGEPMTAMAIALQRALAAAEDTTVPDQEATATQDDRRARGKESEELDDLLRRTLETHDSD